jgi:hypothetical protein
MKSLLVTLALPLLVLLGGCADRHYAFPGHFGQSAYGGPSLDLEGLLRFQSDFAHKSQQARAEECRWLLRRQQETPQPGWALRLMIGRTLSESCGDPAKLIRAYESQTDVNRVDQRVTWMAAYQAEVLKRLGGHGRKATVTERKTKGEAAPPAKADKDESKLLKEKLEAIRSMERSLDESAAPDE